MMPTRIAALLVFVIASLAGAAGCGKEQTPVSGSADPTPSSSSAEATGPDGHVPTVSVEPPNASLASSAVVDDAARSVVKVRSVAPSCQKIYEGSGVVIAPNRVMSAAHTVAGGNSVTITADGQEHAATVVSFDPDTDVSILDVPELQAPPLLFAEEEAPTGTDALVLGYPGGGPFAASAVRIRDVIELAGPDIFRTTMVKREVYVIRGRVTRGGAGGPLIDLNSRVLGIVIGAAADGQDTGFALTANQVAAHAAKVGDSQPVDTGACVT